MSLLLGDNNQMHMLICISITIILVLVWYISGQDYRSACDRKLDELKYTNLLHMSHLLVPQESFSGVGPNAPVTDGEKRKQKLNPESDVMMIHQQGDSIALVESGEDPIRLDPYIRLRSEETAGQRLQRNMNTNYDGPQLEGMHAPIEEFESSAMLRQLQGQNSVYAASGASDADKISEMNI